jgi:hypothetical protein
MAPLNGQGIVPRLLELLGHSNDVVKEAAGGAFWNIAWGSHSLLMTVSNLQIFISTDACKMSLS